jgi:hypothetical protein
MELAQQDEAKRRFDTEQAERVRQFNEHIALQQAAENRAQSQFDQAQAERNAVKQRILERSALLNNWNSGDPAKMRDAAQQFVQQYNGQAPGMNDGLSLGTEGWQKAQDGSYIIPRYRASDFSANAGAPMGLAAPAQPVDYVTIHPADVADHINNAMLADIAAVSPEHLRDYLGQVNHGQDMAVKNRMAGADEQRAAAALTQAQAAEGMRYLKGQELAEQTRTGNWGQVELNAAHAAALTAQANAAKQTKAEQMQDQVDALTALHQQANPGADMGASKMWAVNTLMRNHTGEAADNKGLADYRKAMVELGPRPQPKPGVLWGVSNQDTINKWDQAAQHNANVYGQPIPADVPRPVPIPVIPGPNSNPSASPVVSSQVQSQPNWMANLQNYTPNRGLGVTNAPLGVPGYAGAPLASPFDPNDTIQRMQLLRNSASILPGAQ